MEQLRGARQELEEEKTKRTDEQEALKSQLQYLKDPTYQKHLIHKELGYVEEDEAIIKFSEQSQGKK